MMEGYTPSATDNNSIVGPCDTKSIPMFSRALKMFG